MTGKKQVQLTHAYKFQNGMVMAFDQNGEQMPEYQGRSEDVEPKIRADFPHVTIEERMWR